MRITGLSTAAVIGLLCTIGSPLVEGANTIVPTDNRIAVV